MKKKNVDINVEYLTRVEGHGNIVINVKEGKLDTCRLDIVESPRFFEGMLRGRSTKPSVCSGSAPAAVIACCVTVSDPTLPASSMVSVGRTAASRRILAGEFVS